MTMTASLASVLWVLVVAQALHAITFAAHHSACMTLVSHHFSGGLRARGQALLDHRTRQRIRIGARGDGGQHQQQALRQISPWRPSIKR